MKMNYVFVGLGGLLGAVARGWLFNLNVDAVANFPWITLLINICGSFLFMAILRFWASKQNLSEQLKLGITTGFLGAFTTFSSYSIDVVRMTKAGYWFGALGYMLLTSVGCLLAGFLGDFLICKLTPKAKTKIRYES